MSDDLIRRQIARRMAYQTTQIGRLEDDLLRVMGERNTALERIAELERENAMLRAGWPVPKSE